MQFANQQQIQDIFTENIVVAFDDDENRQFNIRCPFTPDLVEVSAAIMPYASAGAPVTVDINPVQSSHVAGGVAVDDQYFFNSNIFGIFTTIPFLRTSGPTCVAGVNGSYNPVSKFFNVSRQTVQGTYDIHAENLTTSTRLDTGSILLTLVFTRYQTNK